MIGNLENASRELRAALAASPRCAEAHLEIGEIDDVLALFDDQIYGAQSGVVLDMVDASALLWRLMLRGIDVGNRWDAVAANWVPVASNRALFFAYLEAASGLSWGRFLFRPGEVRFRRKGC